MATPLTPEPVPFFDNNGDPLAGGKVYFYEVGTTNFKTTWQDPAEGTGNTNPVTLDSAGRWPIWIRGSYDMLVKDTLGNTITNRRIDSAYEAVSEVLACTATGTDDITLTQVAGAVVPKVVAYKTGMLALAVSAGTSTAAVRAQIAALGLRKVYSDMASPPTQAVANDILALTAIALVYDEALDGAVGGWHLLGATAGLASRVTALEAAVTALTARVAALEALRATSFLAVPTSYCIIRMLGGNVQLAWGGSTALAHGATVTIAFPNAYPNAAYSVEIGLVSTGGDGGAVTVSNKLAGSFDVTNTGVPVANIAFNWCTQGGQL